MNNQPNPGEPQIAAFEAEGADVSNLLDQLQPEDWQRRTGFKDWTVWDVVAHLHFTDHMGMTTIAGPEPFKALMADIAKAKAPLSVYTRNWLGEISGAELLTRWRALLDKLVAGLRAADPEVRLTWPGPGMKPRMFATARQMETWAHATEIYDLLDAPRSYDDRIENIATIGVRTYGWTFANRKLEAPAPAPYVRLTAPSGAIWEYNEPQAQHRIEGSAVEFSQVVTQVRNIADTTLQVSGANASDWMRFAQCFAGPPVDPPAPGTRGPKR
ncbi:MAG: TIGR03084 family metal-binding protein [Pseudomonadales bacterium]